MKKNLLILTLIVVSAFLISCSKDSNRGNSSSTGTNVYIAGTAFSYGPFLWKNGIATQLPTPNVPTINDGDAYSVFVSGSDVYVAGQNYTRPCLWKNAIATTLDITEGAAYSVCVSGSDVYVAGFLNDLGASYQPILWKNGIATRLPLLSHLVGIANATFVSGNDVYAVGDLDGAIPVLWKNGNATVLDSLGGTTKSVFVSGNDVYVTGLGHNGGEPVLWKNGVAQALDSNHNQGRANAVFVSGNDVYVVGFVSIGTVDFPLLWKNLPIPI